MPDQDLKHIENLYDRLARNYAQAFSGEIEKKPQDEEILIRFAREMGEGKPVWDFGCGPGQTTRYLKNLGLDISGLDLSGKMLDQARALHPDLHFQKGNMLALEFSNGSLAGVVAFYALVHFGEGQVRKALKEVFRVLQPGGLLLFTYHVGGETLHLERFLGRRVDTDFMFFTGEFISACLQECGFEQVEIIEREPYPGVEYQSRRAYVFARKPTDLK